MNYQAIVCSFILAIGAVLICISTRTADEDSGLTNNVHTGVLVTGIVLTVIGGCGYLFTIYEVIMRAHRKFKEQKLRKLEEQVVRRRTATMLAEAAAKKERTKSQRELRLQPLGRSELYSRRTAEIRKRTTEKNCDRCKVPFEQNESFLAVDSTSWHLRCFLCAQCFEPISDATYYNVDGRMYCEHDFKVLYAPICAKCGEFVIGHVIKSINCSYHPDCFKCSECSNNLDEGVYIFDAKLYCSDCNKFLERKPTYICKKCKQLVDEDEFLHFEGEIYHASHFDCSDCKKTLTKNARQKDKDLFCERCFDLRCESCADCRTPIDPQKERSILVLGRHYHLNHFRCAACGQPFAGKEHYERGNKAFLQGGLYKGESKNRVKCTFSMKKTVNL
ncbi:unnamed protein product [Caenorhabditis auriculariae]|uniref:LIM zinc-binding domain-containing protein n=1 Tax=Caenorhabditis auriculariae TaxID=2777116 RepID=A0A8S1H979_9PELO|nr:unnamed protein product [Caenorhabditis auriculariae]